MLMGSEAATLAGAYLPRAKALLRGCMGRRGEEAAGAALTNVLRRFNPSINDDFAGYFAANIGRCAISVLREEEGRKGSGRAKVRAMTVSQDKLVRWRSTTEVEVNHADEFLDVCAANQGRGIDPLESEEAWEQGLRTIAGLEGPAQRRALGRFLGDFSTRTLQAISQIQFADTAECADCILLAGAALDRASGDRRPGRSGVRMARLSVRRSQRHWPMLAFLLLVLEGHGFAMDLAMLARRSGRDLEAVYRSQSDRLAWLPARRRWYGAGKAQIPGDMPLTELRAAFWLASAINRGPAVRLWRPGAEAGTWRRLAQAWGQLVGACPLIRPAGGLEFTAGLRPVLTRWLGARIPAAVWECPVLPEGADDE